MPPEEQPLEVHVADKVGVSEGSSRQKPPAKYAPLADYLAQIQANAVTLRFDRIESELGVELPASARTHRSWWANDQTSHVQSLAWMSVGWRVDEVDMPAERVVFRRTISVLQQLYFADLLERLKEARPGLTRATKTQPQSWWNFSAGKAGLQFSWAFTQERTLRVELYIDTGSREQNKAVFDVLVGQKAEIEREVGQVLDWERLDNKQASRISLSRPATPTDDPEGLEEAKRWALEIMLKFVDAFQPRIREL
jgi:hypothetical protein